MKRKADEMDSGHRIWTFNPTIQYRKYILNKEFICKVESWINDIRDKKPDAWEIFGDGMRWLGVRVGVHYHSADDLPALLDAIRPYAIENVILLSQSPSNYLALCILAEGLGWKEHVDYRDFQDLARKLFVYAGGFPFTELPLDIKHAIYDMLVPQRKRCWLLVCKEWRNALLTEKERQVALLGYLEDHQKYFPCIDDVLRSDNLDIAEKMISVGMLTLNPEQSVNPLFLSKNGHYINGAVILDTVIASASSLILGRACSDEKFWESKCQTQYAKMDVLDILYVKPVQNRAALILSCKTLKTSLPWEHVLFNAWNYKVPVDIIQEILHVVLTPRPSEEALSVKPLLQKMILSIQQKIRLGELFGDECDYDKKVIHMFSSVYDRICVEVPSDT